MREGESTQSHTYTHQNRTHTHHYYAVDSKLFITCGEKEDIIHSVRLAACLDHTPFVSVKSACLVANVLSGNAYEEINATFYLQTTIDLQMVTVPCNNVHCFMLYSTLFQ